MLNKQRAEAERLAGLTPLAAEGLIDEEDDLDSEEGDDDDESDDS